MVFNYVNHGVETCILESYSKTGCTFHNFIFSVFFFSLGYDGRGRLIDEEDSACPALLEREFHSLHRNVPGLRRAGVDTNAIRQVNQPINSEWN